MKLYIEFYNKPNLVMSIEKDNYSMFLKELCNLLSNKDFILLEDDNKTVYALRTSEIEMLYIK